MYQLKQELQSQASPGCSYGCVAPSFSYFSSEEASSNFMILLYQGLNWYLQPSITLNINEIISVKRLYAELKHLMKLI